LLLVITDADEVAGLTVGTPGDVEPVGASEELVGESVVAQEVDEALEPGRVFGTDIGGLILLVLRVGHAAHPSVHVLVAEA
jgi:hypothetical protein